MVYTAKDGNTFEKLQDYKKYVFKTEYTFSDKKDETLVKRPGDIDGQPFDIYNLQRCVVMLLDHTEQIQIDDLVDCKVFIGASGGPVFTRGCKNCTFTVCCRQLRATECIDCVYNLYAMTDPAIELSNNLIFRPFNGAYPQLSGHLRSAGLDPNTNKWSAVYDFNDPDAKGGGLHFRTEKAGTFPPPPGGMMWFPAPIVEGRESTEADTAVPNPIPGGITQHSPAANPDQPPPPVPAPPLPPGAAAAAATEGGSGGGGGGGMQSFRIGISQEEAEALYQKSLETTGSAGAGAGEGEGAPAGGGTEAGASAGEVSAEVGGGLSAMPPPPPPSQPAVAAPAPEVPAPAPPAPPLPSSSGPETTAPDRSGPPTPGNEAAPPVPSVPAAPPSPAGAPAAAPVAASASPTLASSGAPIIIDMPAVTHHKPLSPK